jgi:integrase
VTLRQVLKTAIRHG